MRYMAFYLSPLFTMLSLELRGLTKSKATEALNFPMMMHFASVIHPQQAFPLTLPCIILVQWARALPLPCREFFLLARPFLSLPVVSACIVVYFHFLLK